MSKAVKKQDDFCEYNKAKKKLLSGDKTYVQLLVVILVIIFISIGYTHVILLTALCLIPLLRLGLFNAYDYLIRLFIDLNYTSTALYMDYISGFRICEYGDCFDSIPSDEKDFLIGNHLSWMDSVFFMQWYWKKGLLAAAHNVVWSKMLKVPYVYAGYLRGDVLLDLDWKKDKETIKETMVRFMQSYHSRCVTLFPEGAIFSEVWKDKSDNFCAKKGIKTFNKVLCPRFQGFAAFLRAMHPKLCKDHPGGAPKYLYDLTVKYEGWDVPQPGFFEPFFPGSHCKNKRSVHVHVQKINLSELPCDSDERIEAWLESSFYRKDELLDYFEKHGAFPANDSRGSRWLEKEGLGTVGLWLIWVVFTATSTYTMYCVLKLAISSLLDAIPIWPYITS